MRHFMLLTERRVRTATGRILSICALVGPAGVLQAGVLLAPPPPISALPPHTPALQAAPVTTPAMTPAPLQTGPLQRIDEHDLQVASEVQSLKLLASSGPPARRGKRAPHPSDAGEAAWKLGLIYVHGAGVPQDLGLAQHWFEQALALNQRIALAGLAWCAIEGCRNPPRPSEAAEWIQPLKRVQRPRALYLEWMALDRLQPLRTARPELQPADDTTTLPGRPLLLAAARAGDLHAQIELGLNAMARGRASQAIAYFQAAAPQSNVAAMNAAIVAQSMQLHASVLHEDQKIAEELFTDAQKFHRGEGRPVNPGEAIRLYRLAASKGSTEAERMLALIYSRPSPQGGVDMAWFSQLGQLNLSRNTPSLRAPKMPPQLQRERTALIDFLPAKWRARIH